jgi:hypothetical protein
METFINASSTGEVRTEETGGTEYLVAPVTFIKSMDLHLGYVPEREIEKATEKWPGTRVIADHPKDESGEFVSINNPTADKTPFGFIDDTTTKTNGTAETFGEVWINVEKAESIGGEAEEIKEELANNRTIGVSAAYGGIRLPSGVYDGEERDRVVGNLRPDHVALLRNREGRCSITDGCMAGPNAVSANSNVGLMLNAVSLNQDIDLTPPVQAQENAQKVLDWRDEYPDEIEGMTEVGWRRANQLASGDTLSKDVVKRMAQFKRHQENGDLDDDKRGKPWTDAGYVAWLGWGGDIGIEWAVRKSEELNANTTDDPVSPEFGQGEGTKMTEAFNVRGSARTPEYEGVESTSWSDVSKTLTAVTDALDINADSVGELTSEQKTEVAELTLLGEADADDWRDLYFFPVVNHNTGDLNEGALEAVISGRGSQADISDEAYDSAASTATGLLESEFDRDLSSNAKTLIERGLTMLGWNGEINDGPAESGSNEKPKDSNMSERTSELVDIGFNAENLPDEDTECFDRIHEEFAGNADDEEPDDEDNDESDDGGDEEPDESPETEVTFDSEEEFEEAVSSVVDDAVDEALAANQKAEEKRELADEVIANSDDYGTDDRDTLMDSPVSVLEKLSTEVSNPNPSPDFGATRGVSANQEADGSKMPALSVNERMEGDD